MNTKIFWDTLKKTKKTKKWEVKKDGAVRCATGQCPVVGVVHEIFAPLWEAQEAIKKLPKYVDRGRLPITVEVQELDPVDAEEAGNLVDLDFEFVSDIVHASDYTKAENEADDYDKSDQKRWLALRTRIFKTLGLPMSKL